MGEMGPPGGGPEALLEGVDLVAGFLGCLGRILARIDVLGQRHFDVGHLEVARRERTGRSGVTVMTRLTGSDQVPSVDLLGQASSSPDLGQKVTTLALTHPVTDDDFGVLDSYTG